MIARLVLPLSLALLFTWGSPLVALADLAGSLTIAGNGPELATFEPLARATSVLLPPFGKGPAPLRITTPYNQA